MTINQQILSIHFPVTHVFSNSFYIASHGAAINFLLISLFFLPIFLLIKYQFISTLAFESSAIYKLGWFWCSEFWLLRINLCHVRHTSQITTCGTIFWEIFFVRSWAHAFLITNIETFGKKLLAVRPEKRTRRKLEKKPRIATAKLFA